MGARALWVGVACNCVGDCGVQVLEGFAHRGELEARANALDAAHQTHRRRRLSPSVIDEGGRVLMMVVMQVGAPLYQCEGGAIRQNHGLHDLILPPPRMRKVLARDELYRWKNEVLARSVRAKFI